MSAAPVSTMPPTPVTPAAVDGDQPDGPAPDSGIAFAQVARKISGASRVTGRDDRAVARSRRHDDPAHQSELERLRARRRLRDEVEVEIRPLARYDQLIPA